MGDLEDRILKKNIPGKYSWWEKDSDEEGEGVRAEWLDPDASDPEAELTELQKQQKWVEAECPEPIRRSIMARQEKESSRTGVKGVLADYEAWRAAADADDQLQAEYRHHMLQKMAGGHRTKPAAAGPGESVSGPGARRGKAGGQGGGSSEEEEDDDDGDDERFLEEYRSRRLRQLKASAGRPQFGEVREVTRADFVAAVDAEDPRSSVVVHLYEPYVDACRKMNRFLEVIARAQPEVKFLRLLSSAADGEYDPVALPTLLVYRDRQVVACVARVTDDLGENFTQADVEWLLQEHDVFEATSSAAAAAAASTAQAPGQTSAGQGSSLATARARDGAGSSEDEGSD